MLNYEIEKSYFNVIDKQNDVIALLMKHSFESFVFSVRTGEFNYAIAKELGYGKEMSERYFLSGLYHDVGKLGMSKFMIDYPGRYTESMRNEMKKHTEGGAMLLSTVKADDMLIETAKYHHCNFDGSGYLEELSKEKIPFHARLTRLSDSADAYLSTRSYKEGYKVSGLYDDMKKFSGTWYDPKIVEALKNVHNRILKQSTNSPDKINQDEYMYFLKKIYDVQDTAEFQLFNIIRNAK